MDLRSSARGLLVFLHSLSALQGDDWAVTYTSSNVCAPRGSTVYISCTYKYPKKQDLTTTVQETLWFTKKDGDKNVNLQNDTDYAGRVEYSCEEHSCTRNTCKGKCTLSITDLRQNDSAEYKFRFTTNQPVGKCTGDPGVTLSVTDLQVKVSFPYPYDPTWARLECHSMCGLAGNPTYSWILSRKSARTGMYYEGDIRSQKSYSCAVKGFEHFPSPSVYAPKTPSVTVNPSGEIEEGSSVTLSCSSDANPAANYTWFKEHEDSVGQSGQNYTITNITSELGGNYYCQAHNAIGSHNSTFLFINMTETPSSFCYQQITTAVGTVAVLLATILLLVPFLLMRRKRVSRKASGLGPPDTVGEPLAVPVSNNALALTNRSAPEAQREPIEQQDDLYYASIHIFPSENKEVLRCFAGSLVQSDQTEEVLYSAVKDKRPNAVPEGGDQTETGETSELYSTVK